MASHLAVTGTSINQVLILVGSAFFVMQGITIFLIKLFDHFASKGMSKEIGAALQALAEEIKGIKSDIIGGPTFTTHCMENKEHKKEMLDVLIGIKDALHTNNQIAGRILDISDAKDDDGLPRVYAPRRWGAMLELSLEKNKQILETQKGLIAVANVGEEILGIAKDCQLLAKNINTVVSSISHTRRKEDL